MSLWGSIGLVLAAVGVTVLVAAVVYLLAAEIVRRSGEGR